MTIRILLTIFALTILNKHSAHSAPNREANRKCVLPSSSKTTEEISYRDAEVKTKPSKTKNFWSGDYSRWPKGKIPYTISPAYSAEDRKVIMRAMAEWESKTCVRFIPRTAQHTDYAEITPNDGSSSYCYCYVGRVGGKQIMKMYGECMRHAAMVHELGHLIGFNHEHQRPDRDDFVTIHFQNIQPAYRFAFEKYAAGMVDNRGTLYDYKSVMQYPFYAFTSYDERKPAITLKDGSIQAIYTEADRLSLRDINKTKRYYNNCL